MVQAFIVTWDIQDPKRLLGVLTTLQAIASTVGFPSFAATSTACISSR